MSEADLNNTSVASLRSQQLALHALVYLDEENQVVIGRRDIDSYGVFPPDGAALLRRLEEGGSPSEAAAWYAQTYGESVDIGAFVKMLDELGFVRAGGSPVGAPPGRLRGQRLGQLLFSWPAYALYAAIVAVAVCAAAVHPWLAPLPHHLIFCGSLVVVELTVVSGQALLALVHEGFHVLAGRRLGLRTRVRVSRRLYYVVYETGLDGLVSVPRSRRYLPILAGLLADVLCMALLTLAAVAARGSGPNPDLFARVCLALVVSTLPRIAWQFYLFLETDIYHLVNVASGCYDLRGATRRLLARAGRRALGRPGAAEEAIDADPRDLRIARWYAPVFVAGYLWSAATLVLLMAPLAWHFADQMVGNLSSGALGRNLDAATVLALNTTQLAIAAWIALRDRRAAHSTHVTKGSLA